MSNAPVVDAAFALRADQVARAADFAQAVRGQEDGEATLADECADLRAAGVPWSAIAAALGVVVNSAKERFGCRLRPIEAERLRRRAAMWRVDRPRITVADRHIVADLHEPAAVGFTKWRRVRTCSTPDEAVALAEYLHAEGAGRYVKRPKDGPAPDRVLFWVLPEEVGR